MIDLQDSPEPAVTFAHPERSPGALDASTATALAGSAGDLVLVLDADGVIRDIAAGGRDLVGARAWVGRRLIDTVTVESRPKIEEMLAARNSSWRQVNHLLDEANLPVRYRSIGLGSGGFIVVGRDVRAAAMLQQRLLQVQQSLERDHLRLRQAESQYRMLFDRSAEPLMIVEALSGRIREMNAAAGSLIGVGLDRPAGQPLAAHFAPEDRDHIIGFLGAVAAGAAVPPIKATLARAGGHVLLAASAFRRDGSNYHLLRMTDADGSAAGAQADRRLLELVERMPDAFVVADGSLSIVAANTAFLEMTQAVSIEQLRGQSLEQWLGRPGIDLELIRGQLREHDSVRNIATILFGLDGGQEEVEVSAVRGSGPNEEFGFFIRSVGRRLRDLPPAERDLPRSVEQLTELVGRMPLKNIVRESTDLIERLCIEAALAYTSDNRASAAEILGLSRQSLYSKLHRHGLGNLAADADAEAE